MLKGRRVLEQGEVTLDVIEVAHDLDGERIVTYKAICEHDDGAAYVCSDIHDGVGHAFRENAVTCVLAMTIEHLLDWGELL